MDSIGNGIKDIHGAFQSAVKKAKEAAKQAEKSPDKAKKLTDDAKKQLKSAEGILKKLGKAVPPPVSKEVSDALSMLADMDKNQGRKTIDCEAYSNMSRHMLKAEKKIATEAKKAFKAK